MLKTLIHYQIYIIIGILVFPIFAFITYLIKKMIDRLRFVKELNNIKKPLMERINNIEAIYEIKEKNQEMNMKLSNQIYRHSNKRFKYHKKFGKQTI